MNPQDRIVSWADVYYEQEELLQEANAQNEQGWGIEGYI